VLRSFSRLALSARGLNKDPTVWLDGARPIPNYQLSNYMSLTNSVPTVSNISILSQRGIGCYDTSVDNCSMLETFF
jgi:hypothetical protein